MDKYKFGEFIYQKRKKIGLTQEELGRKLGVTNKAVSKWEVGETLPEITMLEPLANILQVTVDELLKQKEEVVIKKKVQKINILLIIIASVLLFITIITIIVTAIKINNIKNREEVFYVNEENFNEIINIDPMTNFICDGQSVIISSYYELDNKYYLKENKNLVFTIEFEINYYYYLEDGSLGTITYLQRTKEITFTKDDFTEVQELTLKPKVEIENFKCFKNVTVDYTIKDYLGIVYK